MASCSNIVRLSSLLERTNDLGVDCWRAAIGMFGTSTDSSIGPECGKITGLRPENQ